MEQNEFISQVEDALNRMFDPSTSNSEKQQIEGQLQQFKQRPHESLERCYHLLIQSKNQYVLWFGTSMLEETVRGRWQVLTADEQNRLRQFLFDQLMSSSNTLPTFVFTKYAILLVWIGKLTWPSQYPDFFTSMKSLVQNTNTSRIGLTLLKLCAEEFGRDDDALVLMDRKNEVKQMLINELESILNVLTSALQNVLQNIGNPAINTTFIQEQDATASLALQAVLQFLEWAPLGNYLTVPLMQCLLQFAALRTMPEGHGHCFEMKLSSLTALECLTQLIAKKCIPPAFNQFIVDLASSVVSILQCLTADQPTKSTIHMVGDEYLDKMTRFLQIFFTDHLARFENHPQIQLSAFMKIVFEYTSKQPEASGFIACLDLWETFINYIEMDKQKDSTKADNKQVIIATYETGISMFAMHLLDRIRHTTNGLLLSTLDTDIDEQDTSAQQQNEFDDDLEQGPSEYQEPESEYSAFITDCVNLVLRIAEVCPACYPKLLEKVMPLIQSSLQDFFQVHTITTLSQDVNIALRDLNAMIIAGSSLSGAYYSTTSPEDGFQYLLVFLNVARYMTERQLSSRSREFAELHASVMAAIRMNSNVFVVMYNTGAFKEENGKAAEDILGLVVAVTMNGAPDMVLHAAMDLLSTFCMYMPPEFIHGIRNMQLLKDSAHQVSRNLSLPVQGKLFTAISNALLPRSLGSRAPEWEARKTAYTTFANPVIESLKEVALILDTQQRWLDRDLVLQLTSNCRIIEALADAVRESPKPAKEAFYQVVVNILQTALRLLSIYIRNESNQSSSIVTERIVKMFTSVVSALRREIAADFIGEIVMAFITAFQDEKVAPELSQSGRRGALLLAQFLDLLKIVVDEPTAALKKFLPSVLELCFGSMKSLIFESVHRDTLLPRFLVLTQSVFVQHLRFFVTTTVSPTTMKRKKTFASETAYNNFNSLLEAIGLILEDSQTSPRICKQCLVVLGRINQAHKLYSLSLFQNQLRELYVSTILKILLSGQRNSLQEELCAALYDLVSVDFLWFYDQFVPSFLQSTLPQLKNGPIPANWMNHFKLKLGNDIDSPTFTSNILGFVHDYRFACRSEQ